MSAQNTVLTAITAAERGAFDYLPKPFDLKDLIGIVERALAEPKRTGLLAEPVAAEEKLPLVGRSQAMQEIYRTLARLTQSDLTVMITGESGTGKELVARALHDYSRRRHGPFVAINMAAIPRELIESELFGHEKGAFTGAQARSIGRFEQADGGTLFLDEIGDMPMEAQTRLLRVLQEGEYTSVGGRTPIRTNVRIVAATHRNLQTQISLGLFREDLFYRLNVVPLRLPPLRERIDDIPDLVRHFLRDPATGVPPHRSFDQQALERLRSYPWPGNVRELENFVRRITVLSPEETITARTVEAEFDAMRHGGPPSAAAGDQSLGDLVEQHLARYFAGFPSGQPPAGLHDRVIAEVERPLILAALSATNGNQLRAAELLGLNRNTLRKRLRELGLDAGR
jgi:two-component system nitrogen regulation response regulator GlnG